jgi:hypothetical protein
MNQKALLRCQQKTINGAGGVGVGGGMMDGMVPALLQGLNGRQVAAGIAGVNDDEDGVFYDELSYPPQFRAPNHPPAYEVKLYGLHRPIALDPSPILPPHLLLSPADLGG